MLDSILRLIQLFAVTVMGVAFLIFPPLAVFIACVYIFIAVYLFRFCWSHLVFSTKILFDYLFARGQGKVDLEQGIPCFSGHGLQGCYPRTSGRLVRRGAQFLFVANSMIGAGTEYEIDTASLSVHEGAIFGTIVLEAEDDDVILVMLTPQMNGQEEKLALEIGCTTVPFAFTNGIRNGFRHIRAQFQG